MNTLYNDLIAKVNEVAADHGMVLDYDKVKLNYDGMTVTVVLTDPSKKQQVANVYGIELGKVFKHRGEIYEVVGFNPRSPKYPVIGKRADGKQFKFTEGMVNG